MLKLISILALLVSVLFTDNDPQLNLIAQPKYHTDNTFDKVSSISNIERYDQLLTQKAGQDIVYFEFMYAVKDKEIVKTYHKNIHEKLTDSDLAAIKNAQKGDLIVIDNITVLNSKNQETKSSIFYYIE